MSEIVIYSRPSCSRCTEAENWLRSRDIVFVKRNVDNYREKLLKENPELKKLPIVEIDGKVIGTFEDLKEKMNGI